MLCCSKPQSRVHRRCSRPLALTERVVGVHIIVPSDLQKRHQRHPTTCRLTPHPIPTVGCVVSILCFSSPFHLSYRTPLFPTSRLLLLLLRSIRCRVLLLPLSLTTPESLYPSIQYQISPLRDQVNCESKCHRRRRESPRLPVTLIDVHSLRDWRALVVNLLLQLLHHQSRPVASHDATRFAKAGIGQLAASRDHP
jgi:hypothetical protein